MEQLLIVIICDYNGENKIIVFTSIDSGKIREWNSEVYYAEIIRLRRKSNVSYMAIEGIAIL